MSTEGTSEQVACPRCGMLRAAALDACPFCGQPARPAQVELPSSVDATEVVTASVSWREFVIAANSMERIRRARNRFSTVFGYSVVGYLFICFVLFCGFAGGDKVPEQRVAALQLLFLCGAILIAARLYVYRKFLYFHSGEMPAVQPGVKPIVLLGGRPDDRFSLRSTAHFPGLSGTWLARAALGFRVPFEQALAGILQKTSAVITVSRPEDGPQRQAAAYFWPTADANWREVTQQLLDDSQFVVVVMTNFSERAEQAKPALHLEQLVSSGDLSKVVLVVPPTSEEDAAWLWDQYRAYFPRLPAYVPGAIVVRFDRAGNPRVAEAPTGRSRPARTEDRYREFIQLAAPAVAEVEHAGEHSWRSSILEADIAGQLQRSQLYFRYAIGFAVGTWVSVRLVALLLRWWIAASGDIVTLPIYVAAQLLELAQFVGFGYALRLYAYSRFLKYRSAVTPRLLATAEPIVLLRSFADDRFHFWTTSQLPQIPFLTNTWLTQLFFGFRITLEEALAGPLQRLAPLITVGRPGDPTPRAGAARLWIRPEVDWQEVVERMTRESCLVVAIMTDLESHPGSNWEVAHLLSGIDRTKLILVVPPVSEQDAERRREQYRAHLPELPEYVPAATTVGFDASGAARVTTAPRNWLGLRRRTERSYRTAMEGRLVERSITAAMQTPSTAP